MSPPSRLIARLIARALPAVLCLLAVACTPASPAPLTVFAAASLKESLDEAAGAYTARTGVPVRVAYAGTPALARQIGQGAPADVFVSADRDWMDTLQREGRIDAASRRDLLGNALVLVAPANAGAAPVVLRSGVDLLPLLGPDGRLAVALTASVPAGRYAHAALASLGQWNALRPRLAEVENVRAALVLVARGEAALGIVYATDALAEPRVRIVGRFPPGSHPPIVYPAARVAASTHPRAGAFLEWLAGPEAAAVFRRHGFVPLP